MSNFKTKARAVELLGRKQIRDGVTALSELMKNSFDADAEWILVDFMTNVENPYIIIADDGYGMDENDILNKWLVLGTDSKKVNKIKRTPKGRILKGEKGIGRLAAARLGDQFLMISKKSTSEWNIVYLNWNIFENPNLFIQDITVPSFFNINSNELINDNESLIRNLKSLQLSNMNLKEWYIEDKSAELKTDTADTYNIIKRQIIDFQIPFNHIRAICNRLDKKGYGTILLIQNIKENWNNYLNSNISSKDREDDIISDKNYTRFAAFASNFKNAASDLTLEIKHNKETLEFNFDYTDLDYEIYDLKIEGVVSNGIFTGKISARNADENVLNECNDELEKGIVITSGIRNPETVDCGPYSVTLCHFENVFRNTGLTPEEHLYIRSKVEVTGGIGVFRDNVRILPYGEPENDFLNLEKRRSLHAGNYLFSHRNIFGRIDISSFDNPNLEDKSSREGLIENEQFHYFIKTMENLLINIAKDYITSSSKHSKGLRDTYVAKNQQLAEDKIKQDEALKMEEELLKKSISLSKKLLKDNMDEFNTIESKATEFLRYWHNRISTLEIDIGYDLLSSYLNEFKIQNARIVQRIVESNDKLIITPSQRFLTSYSNDLLSNIYKHNDEIKNKLNNLLNTFNDKSLKIENILIQLMAEWIKLAKNSLLDSPDNYINIMLPRIDNILKSIDNTKLRLNNQIDSEKDNLELQISIIREKIHSIEKIHEDLKLNVLNGILQTLRQKTIELKSELTKLTSLPPDKIDEHAGKIVSDLNNIEKQTYDYSQRMYLEINKSFSNLLPDIQPIISYLKNQAETNSIDYLIGILKKEKKELENQLEISSDLASLGLAAEIVSHEFNQLFTNVNDAIRHLKKYNLPPNIVGLIRQIETGFRAISDRQSQLSPMYRSYNLPKRSIKLRNLVDDMRKFFMSTLEMNKIDFLNDVDENVEIIISPSKLYPVLSNLIHNSIYWVLDRQIKTICFHFDEDENALYIEDSGIGISKNISTEIFKPFFSKKASGRGLGLSISKKVLESQGHNIELILDSPKKHLSGACFRIIFNSNK